jgi:hypothetical protein
MKPTLLFPPFFRLIGFVLALGGLILAYICIIRQEAIVFLDHDGDSITKNFAATFEVLGLLFIGFSRQKKENENICLLRLNALYWSTLVGFLLVLLNWVLNVVGTELDIRFLLYWPALFGYYPFVLLWIFVGRFYYRLSRDKQGNISKPVYLFPYRSYLPFLRAICIFSFLLIIVAENIQAVDDLLKKIAPDYTLFIFPVSLLIWTWSKQKNENDLITGVRLMSMQAAVYLNYILLLMAIWYYYGFDYLSIEVDGLVSIPILFLFIFYFRLFRLQKNPKEIALTNS